MVTISFFSRTFSRWNGGSCADENFSSRLSSRPPNNSPARNSAIKASIASDAPAIVPLMPSGASSNVPLMPNDAHNSRNGSRKSRKSGNGVNW